MSESLPGCRWRREPTIPGRHACVSPRLVVHSIGVTPEDCTRCRVRDHPAPAREAGICAHLGPRTRTHECAPCSAQAGRRVALPVHACTLHTECSVAARVPGLWSCVGCPDHLPQWRRAEAGDVRHLTYHVYPRGDVWRWNITQLRQRMSIFNGRRIVAVAHDDQSDPTDLVAAALEGCDCEILDIPNRPDVREMASHMLMIETLSQYRSARDVTWYGHAKGITTRAAYPGVARWTEELYRGTLDYWPLTRAALRDHCTCGVFRRLKTTLPGSNVGWHYSGSYRWTRNRDLYQRDWRAIDSGWCGGEGYVARHFALPETACLYGEFGRNGLGLYKQETWDEWAAACCDAWHAEHARDHWAPQLLTVILTAHRQPQLVHDAIGSVRAQTCPDWQLLIVDSGVIHATGAYDRYRDDARISVMLTGEAADGPRAGCPQGWAINGAWRAGRVRGDLVLHLSDDDVLDPTWIALVMRHAELHPEESAWYGWAGRQRITADGHCLELPPLHTRGVGDSWHRLRCQADGMQVVHRRGARTDWPEDRERAPHADGWWMDQLSGAHPIHPLPHRVGTHRHTPLSTYTQ